MNIFKNRVLLVILGAIALLVVVGSAVAAGILPRTFTDFYAQFTGEELVDAIDEPIEVTHGSTTLSLKQASVVGSQTVVEFILVDPVLPEDAELFYQFRSVINSKEVILEGFESNEVLLIRESRRVPGQLALTLELPAPARADSKVVIEIPEITLIHDEGDSVMDYIQLGGPWRFEFIPNMTEAQRETTVIPLNIEGRNEGVAIRIDQLEQTSNEALISYRLLPPTHPNTQPLGEARLLLDGLIVEGRSTGGPSGANNGGDDNAAQTIGFPARVLADHATFEVEFGPYWVPDELPLEVTLDVEQLRAGGEEVVVKGYPLHFSIEPSEAESLTLLIRPVDGEPIPFTPIGPGARLEIEDDTGHTYELIGDNLALDPDRGKGLKEQRFLLGEQLSDDASAVTLQASTSGKIASPVQIPVTMP